MSRRITREKQDNIPIPGRGHCRQANLTFIGGGGGGRGGKSTGGLLKIEDMSFNEKS